MKEQEPDPHSQYTCLGDDISSDDIQEASINTILFFEVLRNELSIKEGKNYVYKRINKQSE